MSLYYSNECEFIVVNRPIRYKIANTNQKSRSKSQAIVRQYGIFCYPGTVNNKILKAK
ncbi:DEHA2E08426p [Debaryomyces hansenii CBS767]|uniref:DEHA2E08426p n=1 Tax=Debaryomyces hansenii (strain ATCC 36239 / CBS 767 / BCRC 21394 / JCM 1990 / NBRC 0083 / IGC 2968) TaxID=284592 RepID=B5RTX6_DEBHA|nr:DEHA2E08426p [Debaryomyces hansenii CBS767]CAR65788.1 DEHA2E08426p [Debaryomyces hansenii CBS767]|eukprot:XP_002770445.1 DEHA2E08426p [Debaryomyces hansenii CBS767]